MTAVLTRPFDACGELPTGTTVLEASAGTGKTFTLAALAVRYVAEGHAALATAFDTPIATGEMLASVAEHEELIRLGGADVVQPDAPRIGGITQFLKVMAMAEQRRLQLAPHFAMEIHVHLAAAYPQEPWVEHFEWLDPLFEEHLEIDGGRMHLSPRPGLGITISEQARAWTVAEHVEG